MSQAFSDMPQVPHHVLAGNADRVRLVAAGLGVREVWLRRDGCVAVDGETPSTIALLSVRLGAAFGASVAVVDRAYNPQGLDDVAL